MFKRLFFGICLVLIGFSFSNNVKANDSIYIMYINVNNESVEISLENSDRFYLDYYNGVLTIRNNTNVTKVFELNTEQLNTLTFETNQIARLEGWDEQTFIGESDIKISELKFTFNDDLLIEYNNEYFINLRGEIELTFILQLKPAITGSHAIINDIEKPYTIEEIRSIINLQAYDGYDGDLTHKIVIESETYNNNKNVVGNFEINFAVENSSKVTTKYKLIVVNKDFTAPTISGPSSKTYGYKENITMDDLKALFIVDDNYDDDLILNVETNNFKENTVGEYNLVFNTKDNAGNKTSKQFSLSIIDNVKPTIIDGNEGVIKINYKEKITDGLLLLGLTANDEIDGNLTSNIKVIENNLGKELTTYLVKYEVSDNSGNIFKYERTYQVISSDIPNFFISSTVLTIEDVNALTIDQLAELLSSISNIEMESYEVVVNEYEGNENISGIYKLSVNIKDTEGNEHLVTRNISVFNSSELNNPPKNNVLIVIVSSITIITIIGFIVYKKRK